MTASSLYKIDIGTYYSLLLAKAEINMDFHRSVYMNRLVNVDLTLRSIELQPQYRKVGSN